MRSGTILILSTLGILLWGVTASAGTFVSLGAPAGTEIVDLQVAGQADVFTVEYNLAGFEIDPVSIGGNTYYSVNLGSEAISLAAGSPELPHIARSVIIPDNARMGLRVLSATYQDFTDIDVVPSKGNLLRSVDPSTVPYEFGAVYAQDAWYPQEIATQGDPYILRDFRGMVVDIHPIQYNPALHTLRVFDHIVVEVVPVGPGEVNVIDRPSFPDRVNGDFAQLYVDHFINDTLFRYAPIGEVGEMIVIAYDDFVASMQPFVDWKNQMGLQTTLFAKSDVGTNYSQFESFIQAYYDANDLAFVLLVGDLAQIPSPTNGGAPADPIYALVDGSDNYPDIFIGRLSAENVSQVELQVQKFVEYEQMPAADGAWYHKGVGIASNQGPGDDGEYDDQHIDNIRDDLLAFTYTEVDQIYDPYGTAAAVAAAVNDGRSVINYCGHGSLNSWSSSGFSSNHVNQLVNHNELPWIISVACVNGAFQSSCFAEAWLRASDGGQPTGAIGMYASTVNMSWNPPMAAQDETADLFVDEEKRTFGALCFSGSCLMIDEYGYAGVSEFKNWHVFGDPSTRVRSDTPTALDVTHDEIIEPDATTFTVTVPGIEGALCGLSDSGTFLGSAFTDVSGVAEITVEGDISALETVTLTATAFNKIPYITAVNVGELLIPEVLVTPSELVVYMDLEATHVEELYISNVGMEGSVLDYSLRTGGMGVITWLSMNPASGEVPSGETDVVEVTFDTHGLSDGIYEAEIIVLSNGGRATVPVELRAGEYADVADRGGVNVLSLQPARPNPFAQTTGIAFSLPQTGIARLGIYDLSGRLVRTLASGTLEAGSHRYAWDGRNDRGQAMAGGVYLYRLETEQENLTGKVTVLR